MIIIQDNNNTRDWRKMRKVHLFNVLLLSVVVGARSYSCCCCFQIYNIFQYYIRDERALLRNARHEAAMETRVDGECGGSLFIILILSHCFLLISLFTILNKVFACECICVFVLIFVCLWVRARLVGRGDGQTRGIAQFQLLRTNLVLPLLFTLSFPLISLLSSALLDFRFDWIRNFLIPNSGSNSIQSSWVQSNPIQFNRPRATQDPMQFGGGGGGGGRSHSASQSNVFVFVCS